MSTRVNTSQGAISSQCERVAGWKTDLHSFFTEDWSRLRELIMELEEESWTGGMLAGVSEDHVEGNETPQNALLQLPLTTGSPGADQRSPSKNRLSDLSEQIESRLRIAHKNNRNQNSGSAQTSPQKH